MPSLGAPEIVIIVLVLVIVFGWKRLPDAARSLGRSARVFKSEVEEMKNDGKPSAPNALPSEPAHQGTNLVAPPAVPPTPPVQSSSSPAQPQPQAQQQAQPQQWPNQPGGGQPTPNPAPAHEPPPVPNPAPVHPDSSSDASARG